MTKAKIKEAYQEWNRTRTREYFEERDKIFEELKELNSEYGDGHKWCNATQNLRGLIGTEKEDRAFRLYNRYHEIEGAHNSFVEFAIAVDNFQ